MIILHLQVRLDIWTVFAATACRAPSISLYKIKIKKQVSLSVVSRGRVRDAFPVQLVTRGNKNEKVLL